MLPEDALRLIQETAVEAARAEVVRIPGDERRAFIVQGLTRQEIELPPAHRAHKLDDLDELCRYVAGHNAENVVVFHGDRSVVALLDDDDRRDRVTLDLQFTAAWHWVTKAAKEPPKLKAKDFLTLLRTTLADCVEPGALHAWQVALRNVRLTTRATTEATNERGLEKLGKEIENQCSGAEAIPETLSLKTEIYRNAATGPAEVAFDVSIDFDAGHFVLTAIGDRVANAIDGAQAILGESVRGQTGLASVFHGTP